VFFDANKNGVQDTNEPSTISDSNGFYDLDIPLDVFDTNNNGLIDNAEGNIVVFGGTDTTTGLPLETPLTAPADGLVATLLTSLVADLTDQGLTTEAANQQVVSALGLPDVDLSSLDPIAATNSNEPGAQETLTAMAKVQNSVTQVANLISGATTTDLNVVVQNVIAAFTSQIQAGSTIDVSNADQLAEIIEQATTTTQQSDPNLDKQQIENVKTDAATVMATANQQIDNIVSTAGTNPDPSQLQFQIAQVQFVALGETSQDLEQAGANSKPIADVVAAHTGAALEAQISVALISDINASSESDVSPVGPASSFLPVNLELVLDPEETEEGTENNDTLTGDSGNDIFLGLSGNDVLNGLEGDDWMNGNRGEDTLFGDSGDDTLYGGKDNDSLFGEDGDDVAFGNWGNDSLFGEDGDDFLNGNQENDTVNGGLGNDTLHGGKNEDNLFGGDGSDVMFGDLGNDVLTGEDGDDFLSGNRGEDQIIGGNGDDTLHGGKDNDILNGGEGNDLLCGDIGNDQVTGGNGEDIFALQLGHGADEVLDFANGVDRIGLAGGFTEADLTITGSNGNTLISSGDELLATLTGVDVSLIDSADFTVLV
jgi:Ca2+-binding RTX toxin-like protein